MRGPSPKATHADRCRVRSDPESDGDRSELSRFTQMLTVRDTALKLYGVQGGGPALRPRLMSAVANLIDLELHSRPYANEVDGAGFVVVFQGRSHAHVLIDRWQRETELLHAGFLGKPDAPHGWEPAGGGEEILTDWYLRLLEFERSEWQHLVLDRASDPDFEAYLQAHGATGPG